MARYRIRIANQGDQPEVIAVEASSVDEARALVTNDGRQILSVELANPTPDSYEPAGDPPPSAPRKVLEADFTGAPGEFTMWLIGGAFTLIGSFFVVGTVIVLISVVIGRPTSDADDPLGFLFVVPFYLFFVIGIGLLRYAWRTRRKRKHLFKNGVAATATIDRSGYGILRVNGSKVRQIEWTYIINDTPYHGQRSSLNRKLANIEEGDRMWILYDPEDPSESVEWPPL